MVGLGAARTQEEGCDFLGAVEMAGKSSDVHKEPPSPTPLLGYMDEQVPVQGTELWGASALGVGGYG